MIRGEGDCDYVGERPKRRCRRTVNGVKARDACPVACGVKVCPEPDVESEEASNLAIQTAKSCAIVRSTECGTGVGSCTYKLISNTVNEDTFLFADRPSMLEMVIPTTDFVENFDGLVMDGDGVPPNVGLTMLSPDESQPPTTVVVVFENAKIVDGSVVYDISQSESQSRVATIDSLFDGPDSDTVPFESCSYFIDSFLPRFLTCGLCTTSVGLLANFGSVVACDAGCVATVELAGGGPLDPIADAVAFACVPLCASVANGLVGRGACTAVRLC